MQVGRKIMGQSKIIRAVLMPHDEQGEKTQEGKKENPGGGE